MTTAERSVRWRQRQADMAKQVEDMIRDVVGGLEAATMSRSYAALRLRLVLAQMRHDRAQGDSE